jgi:metacaspase-1
MRKLADAKVLLGGAKSFFHGLHHKEEPTNEDGLGEENFVEDWKNERKDVWMFSGKFTDQLIDRILC